MGQLAIDTLYPDWTPPDTPEWMERLKGDEKRWFAAGAALTVRHIEQARRDQLYQLTPLIAHFRQPPNVIRSQVGKSVWRKLHHATAATNVKRMIALMKHSRQQPKLEDIVEVKPCHLGKLDGGWHYAAALFAAKHAPRGRWDTVYMHAQDARRMGVEINPRWSLKRLEKEHDAAAREYALKKSDPTPFAEPWAVSIRGYDFERLISQAAITEEGLKQRHCVASYSAQAANELVFVFRVTGKARATLAFRQGLRGAYFELKGPCNRSVSENCRTAALEARDQFRGSKAS